MADTFNPVDSNGDYVPPKVMRIPSMGHPIKIDQDVFLNRVPIQWQWVKNRHRYPNRNPGNWKHGLQIAVPWFNFDPYRNKSQVVAGSFLRRDVPIRPASRMGRMGPGLASLDMSRSSGSSGLKRQAEAGEPVGFCLLHAQTKGR